MSVYAVLDTNVLVSSLLTRNRDSATSLVLDAVFTGNMIPLYNEEILTEYDDVLHRPKFPFSEERIERLLSALRQFGLSVDPTPIGEILPDMDDLVFYEVVMEKRDDGAYLVTGNKKHFPERKFIVTPSEMMAILRRE